MHSTSKFAMTVLSKCVYITCVCVCVNHLKRYKLLTCGFVIVTVFVVFLKKQGATGSLHGCRQWSPMHLTRVWSLINSTYLRPVFISSWWAVANPRTTSPFFNQFQLFQPIWCHFCACTVFAICTLSKSIWNFTGYGDDSLLQFGRSLHQPIPVRCTWSVFARKMHSTTEFAMTVLSKCACSVRA